MIVTPSDCFETFGMSTAEALLYRRPVVVSRIGVLPEFVREQVDGLLFEPGSAVELANRIGYLWDRPELCRQMGRAGRERALAEYSPEQLYPGWMAAFEQARYSSAPRAGALARSRVGVTLVALAGKRATKVTPTDFQCRRHTECAGYIAAGYEGPGDP